MGTTRTILFLAIALLSLGVGGPLQAQETTATPQYVLTDLGTLGGRESSANAINNKGHIVGTAQTAEGAEHAFLWKDGRMEDLDTLPGSDRSVARAINDTDSLVGECRFTTTLAKDTYSISTQAALWKEGKIIGLGKTTATASGINSVGQVVGNAAYDTVKKEQPGFLWADGQLSLLPKKDGFASASLQPYSINDVGIVMGSVTALQSEKQCPCFWIGGQIQILGPPEDSNNFIALAINQRDQIAGEWGQNPCLWTKGHLTNLGHPSGTRAGAARGLNNIGQVVGSIDFGESDYGDQHAFLWQNGRMYKLEDCLTTATKWTLREARGINDQGQIVGIGNLLGKAGTHAFLLTPKRSLPRKEILGDAQP